MTTTAEVRGRAGHPAHRPPRIVRLLLALLLLCLGLAVLGATYEAVMSTGDVARYPAPGRLVDVGGHRLHMHCVGVGAPTVILESGNGGMSLDWEPVMARLTPSTRVCAYDRAGMGWSELGPTPRTPERVADELHTLLRTAGESGPYLLVGHSLGGHFIDQFARRYPGEVVGLVMLDARTSFYERALDPAELQALPGQQVQLDGFFLVLRRVGLLRLLNEQLLTWLVPGFAQLTPEQRAARTTLQSAATRADTSRQELEAVAEGGAALEPPPAGAHPIRVLVSAPAGNDPVFMEAQRQRAHHVVNGEVQIVVGSGHYLQLDAPETVVTAIQALLQTSTSNGK